MPSASSIRSAGRCCCCSPNSHWLSLGVPAFLPQLAKKWFLEQIYGGYNWATIKKERFIFAFGTQVTTLVCSLCGQLFDSKVLPRYVHRRLEPGKAMELSDLLWFCSSTCHTTHLLRQRSIVSCGWCKVRWTWFYMKKKPSVVDYGHHLHSSPDCGAFFGDANAAYLELRAMKLTFTNVRLAHWYPKPDTNQSQRKKEGKGDQFNAKQLP